MSGKCVLELTRSQQLALVDLIARFLCDSKIEEFVDYTRSPAVVTTPGELLRLVSSAPYEPTEEEKIAARGAQSNAMLSMLGKGKS